MPAAGGSDFMIRFGSNLDRVMRDIDMALTKAQRLEVSMAKTSAQARSMGMAGAVAPGAVPAPRPTTGGVGAASLHNAVLMGNNQLRQINMNTAATVNVLKALVGFMTRAPMVPIGRGQMARQGSAAAIAASGRVPAVVAGSARSAAAEERRMFTEDRRRARAAQRVVASQEANAERQRMQTIRRQTAERFSLERERFERERVNARNIRLRNIEQRGQSRTRARLAGEDAGGIVGDTFRRALLFGAVSAAIFKAVDAGLAFIGVMVKMDKQMADLQKTLTLTDQGFDNLVDSAISVARSVRIGTQEVLDAVEIFSKQFKAPDQLETLARSAALFANISGQTIQASAETLTAVIQQYNLSVSEAETVTDSWAAVAANAAVSTKDLGEGVSLVGKVADDAGIRFDKLNGIIGAIVAATGKTGSNVGTGLKRIFERATSEENIQKLQEEGINIFSAKSIEEGKPQFRDFNSILSETADAWDRMTATQKRNVAVAFAGARQYDIFVALMNNWKTANMLAEESLNGLGAAQKQNDAIADTFAKRVQQMGVEFDNFARTLAGPVLGSIGGVVDAIGVMLRAFNEANMAVQILITSLGALGAARLAGGFIFKQFGSTVIDGIRFNKTSRLGRMFDPLTRQGAFGSQLAVGAALGEGVRGIGRRSFAATTGGGLRGGLAGFGARAAGVVGATGGALGLGGATGSTATLIAGLSQLALVVGATVAAIVALNFALDNMKIKTEEVARETDTRVELVRERGRRFSREASVAGDLSTILAEEEGQGFAGGRRATRKRVGQLIKGLRDTPAERVFLNLGITLNDLQESAGASSQKLKEAEMQLKRLGDTSKEAFRERFTALAQDRGVIAEQAEIGRRASLLFDIFRRTTDTSGRVRSEALREGGAGRIIRGGLAAGVRAAEEADPEKRSGIFRDAFTRVLEKEGLIPQGAELAIAEQLFKDITNFRTRMLRELNLIVARGETQQEVQELFEGASLIGRQFGTRIIGQGTAPLENALLQATGEALRITPIAPEVEPFQRGGAVDLKKRRGRGFAPRPVARIDIELNRSLQQSQRLFSSLGTEVDRTGNAVNAYRQALTDVNTAIAKAAGPEEERERLRIQREIFELQQTISEGQRKKDVDVSKEKERLMVLKDQVNQMRKMTEESQQLKAELEIRLRLSKQIAMLQGIIRPGITTAITQAPGLSRERILGQRNLENDIDFAQRRLQQVLSQGQNTPEQRNAAKAIREEIEQMNFQMQQLVDNTNLWTKALNAVGDAFLNKIADRVANFALDFIGNNALGGLGAIFTGPGGTAERDLLEGPLGVGDITGAAGDRASRLAAAVGSSAAATKGAIQSAAMKGATDAGKAQADAFSDEMRDGKAGKLIATGFAGALAGAGIGSIFTQAFGKRGFGGTIGGAIGGAAGSIGESLLASNPILATVVGIAGPLLGGFIGQFFDEDIKPPRRELDELTNTLDDVRQDLQSLEKSLNTVNETMENIINAPANFVLPIAQGILSNSIVAQSAIATPLQAGGRVVRSGPAFLHAGEIVTDEDRQAGVTGGPTISNQFNFTIEAGNNDPREVGEAVMDVFKQSFFEESQRAGNYNQRF